MIWLRSNALGLIAIIACTVLFALRVHDARVQPIHRFGAGAAQGDFVAAKTFNVLTFGAACNGSTDDHVAIAAANTQAAAVNGEVLFPGGVCGTGATLQPSANVTWRGVCGLGGSVIKAVAPLTAVIQMATSQGQSPPNPPQLKCLTIDGNRWNTNWVTRVTDTTTSNCPNCATYGILRSGDLRNTYEDLFIRSTMTDGVHGATHVLPLVIGTVTCTGTCLPSLPVITQPDVTYAGNFAVSPSSTTVQVKINAGGALGIATLLSNFGSGYATVGQTLGANTHLMQTQGAVYQYDTGLKIAWQPGTYTSTDVYQFTVQEQEQYAINAWTHWNRLNVAYSGANYVSDAGLLGAYNSITSDATSAPGTVTSTLGSTLIVGSSTTFLSGASLNRTPRVGDFIWLECGASSNANLFPIAGVMDDTHLAVAVGFLPPSCAASQYAITVGAGYWETDAGDNSGGFMFDPEIQNVGTAFRTDGDGAGSMKLMGGHVEAFFSAAGWSIGGQRIPATAGLGYGVEIKPTTGLANETMPFFLNSGSSIKLDEPERSINTSINGAGFAHITSGSDDWAFVPGLGGGGTYNANVFSEIPLLSLLLVPTSVALTSTNQIIAPPALDRTTNNSSYVELSPNANYTTPSTCPLLAAPLGAAQVMIIRNPCNSGHWFSFFDFSTLGLGAQHTEGEAVAVGPCESVTFVASIKSGTSGYWQQHGRKTYSLEGYSNAAPSDGESSFRIDSTSATAVVAAFHDYTFSVTNGAFWSCDVSAADTNGTDFGFFDGVQMAITSAGTQEGPITTSHTRGSNAGGLPSGWPSAPLAWVNSGGQLQLQFTGVASHTIRLYTQCKMLSAARN